MSKDILIKAEHIFLWHGKQARVAHETMILDTSESGKQILDIPARNEEIDLWNLQTYLVQGHERATWCYFMDYMLTKFLENSYLNIRPGCKTSISPYPTKHHRQMRSNG
jgi:hypothetical protein